MHGWRVGAVAALLLLCSAVVGVACGPGDEPSPRATVVSVPGDETKVERVVDGDTIVVTGGERVRFIGMDTPETKDPRKPVQCFGREASARTERLLPPGTAVALVYDVDRIDRYGRTLAYVYRASDGLFVNASLVRDGYAVAFTVPPNVAKADEFVRLARQARQAGRGLWRACR
jgi:micrococcal nuclease